MTTRARASASAPTLSTWRMRTTCGARAKRWLASAFLCSLNEPAPTAQPRSIGAAITRAAGPSENPFLLAWIAFSGPRFAWGIFRIAGLLPDAALRTSALRLALASLRPARGQGVPTQVDRPDFRYVRAEGKRTSASAAATQGHIRMRWRDGLVLSPSRQSRTLALCHGTCCAEIDRAAK